MGGSHPCHHRSGCRFAVGCPQSAGPQPSCREHYIDTSVHSGGRLRILFNGKRSPVVNDIEADRNGMMSPINAALKVGENELTLQSLDGTPVDVSLQISSARLGGIADSSASDVLDWNGEVKEPVTVKINVE